MTGYSVNVSQRGDSWIVAVTEDGQIAFADPANLNPKTLAISMTIATIRKSSEQNVFTLLR
jgi:hypothetical protein